MKTMLSYCCAVLIALLGLEIALRLYATFPRDATHYILDDNTGYRARPSAEFREGTVTNAAGFNDRDHPTQPPAGAVRIAVVGDSFVFGVVPRETLFTTVLEELASKRGTHLEVMNMGIAAAGPKNYVGLIRHDVAQSNAHIVAVMLFVGNDIVQAHPHFKTSLWLNSTREMLEQPYYVGWSPEYSYLYRSLRYVLRFVREARDDSPRESFTRDTYLAIQKQRTLIYRRELNTFARSGYESIVELVAAMSAEAARQDRQFFVILAPDEVQTNPDIRRQLIDVYDLDAAAYHFDQPQAMLGTALRARGIRVVDLLPEFRRLNQTMPLYIEHDTHWNRQGNRLAAQLIWRHLQAQELPALEN